MQRGVLRLSGVLVAAVLGLILLLWATGGLAALEAWVLQAQRAVQDRLAGAVRAIKIMICRAMLVAMILFLLLLVSWAGCPIYQGSLRLSQA